MLKLLSCRSQNHSFSYRLHIYKLDESGISSLQELSQMKETASQMVEEVDFKEENVETRVNEKKKASLAEILTKYESEKTKLQSELLSLQRENPEGENKQKIEEMKEELKALEQKKAELESKVTAEAEAAIHTFHAEFEKRRKVIDQVKTKFITQLKEDLDDPEQSDEIRARAEAAANIADDGVGHLVADYLSSKLGDKELKDYEVEDITQGIAFVLHQEKEEQTANPAHQFVEKLAKKGEKSGKDYFGIYTDHGVKITDVRKQVLENIGYKFEDEDQKEEAKNSRASHLLNQILTDDTLAPHFRGMLAGKLAQGGEKNKDLACTQVEAIYNAVKKAAQENVQAASPGEVNGYERSDWMVGAIGLAAFPVAALASQPIDENGLKNAAKVFTLLDQATQKNISLEQKAADYRAFLSQLGIPKNEDTVLQKIQKIEATGGGSGKDIKELASFIEESKQKYIASAVEDLDLKINTQVNLYQALGIEGKFPISLEEIKNLRNSSEENGKDIAKFKAQLSYLKRKLNETEPGLMRQAALDRKNEIEEVKKYQTKYNKFKKYLEKKDIPNIETLYPSITSTEPQEVASALGEFPQLSNDVTIARQYFSQVNRAIAELTSRTKEIKRELPEDVKRIDRLPEGTKPVKDEIPPELNKKITSISKLLKAGEVATFKKDDQDYYVTEDKKLYRV